MSVQLHEQQSQLRNQPQPLIDLLTGQGAKFKGRTCTCPWHNDDHPSAGIFQATDGHYAFKCHVCQVTGEYAPDGNVDHLHARKHGGRDTWQNTVWMKRNLNTLKKDKSLQDMGWKLRRRPQAPPTVPMIRLITPKHADWRPFLCLE